MPLPFAKVCDTALVPSLLHQKLNLCITLRSKRVRSSGSSTGLLPPCQLQATHVVVWCGKTAASMNQIKLLQENYT
ncbi:hypothetical protein OK016_06055 [Vibrio chagasii]|nr:hypothetical protein [Vibrio chagasii]